MSEEATEKTGMAETAEENFFEEDNFSMGDLLATLVDLRTLPHVILLVVLSTALYALAQGPQTGTTYSAIGFLSLSAAYALTAYLTQFDSVHRYVRVDGLGEGSFFQSLMVRSLRAWSLPLALTVGLGIVFTVILQTNEKMADWLPLGLASLFLIWSAGQAISFRSGTGSWLSGSEAARDRSLRSGGIKGVATTHMLVVGGFTIAMAFLFGYATKSGSEIGATTHFTWISFIFLAIGIQAAMFYFLRELLEGVSATVGGARFALTWGIASQLFVTWHLTSAWRRLFEEPSAGGMIFEEAVLMVFTVVLAIWALSSRSVKRGGKIFTTDNALFWGLSFGFGYAGSIAMITRITDLFAEGSLATTMGFGHLVTAITLLLIHRAALKRHDNLLTVSRNAPVAESETSTKSEPTAEPEQEIELEEELESDDESDFDDLDDLDIPEPVLE